MLKFRKIQQNHQFVIDSFINQSRCSYDRYLYNKVKELATKLWYIRFG